MKNFALACVALFLCASTASSEDALANGNGITIPANTWVQVCPTASCKGPALDANGYDSLEYNPAIKKHCFIGRYQSLGSEMDNAYRCFSVPENRWYVYEMFGVLHNEYTPYAGHADFHGRVDPTTGLFYIPNSEGSAAQAMESSRLTWIYDPIGLTGRIKDQITKSLGWAGEHQSSFDYLRGVHVQVNPGGTAEYNVAANTWAAAYGTTGSPFPATNLLEACAQWNTQDQSLYVVGGALGGAGGPQQNTIFKIHPSTSSSAVVTLGGTAMTARTWPACAYNPHDNTILVAGGCTTSGACSGSAGQLNDMVLLDLTNLQWVPLAQTVPLSGARLNAFLRMSYDPIENLYVYIAEAAGSGQFQTWVYRRTGGQKVGYKASPDSQYLPVAGINRNGTSVWAKDPSISANSNGVGIGWVEGGIPGGASNAVYSHPYASRLLPSTLNYGSTYDAMMSLMTDFLIGSTTTQATSTTHPFTSADVGNTLYVSGSGGINVQCTVTVATVLSVAGSVATFDKSLGNAGATCTGRLQFGTGTAGTTTQSNDLHFQYINNVPWACWNSYNNSNMNARLWCEGWDGSGWNLGGPIQYGDGNQDVQQMAQLVDIGGVPTIAFVENKKKSLSPPAKRLLYVEQCTGNPCRWGSPLGGAPLNRTTNDATHWPIVDSISITTDGTNPVVAWTEYNAANSTNADTRAQGYVDRWTGSAWAQMGGSINPDASSNPAAYSIGVTWMSGQPYVSLVQRTDTTAQQRLYIVTTADGGTTWTVLGNGSTNCSPAGSCYLNIDKNNGWVQKAVITNDGAGNLFLAQSEQANTANWISLPLAIGTTSAFGEKVRVYVSQMTAAGVYSRVGGALNQDTAYGSAQSPSIAMYLGKPVVTWAEVREGAMRQAYARKWNGTYWDALAGGAPNLSVTTSSLPAWTVNVPYTPQALAASGGTSPYSWAVTTGALPAGLTMTAGTISGTPTGAGSTFTVTVTDSTTPTPLTQTATFTITVNAANSISSGPALTAGVTASAYSLQLVNAGGTQPYTWSVASGTLPTGIALNSAGLLSGTAQTAGTYNFTARVTDSVGGTITKAMTLVVTSNLQITTASFNPGVTGAVYSATLAATGNFGAVAWSISAGALPAGLTLAGNVISGTPHTAGTANFTLAALDAGNNPTTRAETLTITSNLQILTGPILTAGTVGTAYTPVTLSASGGFPSYTWSVIANILPNGLVLTSGGTIQGTPTVAGIFGFNVQCLDAGGNQQTASFSITVSGGTSAQPVSRSNETTKGIKIQ